MDRLSRRKFWMLFCVLICAATIYLGKKWLFVDSSCSRLQDLLLYIGSVAGMIVCLLYVILTKNDSIVIQVISLVFQLVLVLVAVSVAGSIFGREPNIQAVYCNPNICQKASYAKAMRETGKLDAAEEIARTCIVDISNNIIPQQCSSECSRELSLALFEKAGITINALPNSLTQDESGRCDMAKQQLDEATNVITSFDYIDLTNSIQERKNRLLDKCVIVSEPTPTIQYEIIRNGWDVNRVFFDVRVLENNKFLPNIAATDFLVALDGKTVPFSVEEKNADDALCVVSVIDNSGSIFDGIEGMRSAIQKVSDSRKPGDELGMVVFSANNKIKVVQSPSANSLDPMEISGTGQRTALWDGIQVGLDTVSSCQSKNRYLLVLTDGKDNDSIHLEGDDDTKARAIADRAIREGVNICTIGITNQVDPQSLSLVSTGCGYQYAEDYDAVADKIQGLFGYVYGFYRVILNPADVPENSQVVLRIKNAQGVTVDFK
ncbi:hypothetical protein SDC9_43864 [bioreactor metagenome]|uniref:VWFA domain-containing protein n=1 Tax=bioreactor metagenome TaxID=1076179 RepID=A0A644W4Q2_9ZZZZ